MALLNFPRSKYSFYAIALVLLTIIAVIFTIAANGMTETFKSAGVTFNYPSRYKKQALQAHLPDGAVQIANLLATGPVSLISVNKAGSNPEAASLLHISQLDLLEKNAELRFKNQYRNYQKSSMERLKIAGYDTETIAFRYTGSDNKTPIFIEYIMVVVRQNIYYFSIQSTDQKTLQQDAKVLTGSINFTGS